MITVTVVGAIAFVLSQFASSIYEATCVGFQFVGYCGYKGFVMDLIGNLEVIGEFGGVGGGHHRPMATAVVVVRVAVAVGDKTLQLGDKLQLDN
ncbi:hypothetical protein AgCh_027440 [Apium graveolens]